MKYEMFLFKRNSKKRGQLWYIDLLIALFVVIVIAILFVKSIGDIVDREKEINDLLSEGIDISNSLMSKGLWGASPSNYEWCSQSEGRIGFVDNSKIINANFNAFKTLVEVEDDLQNPTDGCQNPGGGSNIDGYTKSRILLGTKFDYVIYLQNKEGDVIDRKAYGNKTIFDENYDNIGQIQNAIDILPNAPENKVNIFRYVYYDADGDSKGELARIGITTWKPK